MTALVLGGGISGLTAARVLQQHRKAYLLLERCPTVGGLTRSVDVSEFCFDYTGHFLHLSRYATPEDIPYASLKNDEWARINRRSCCYVGGKFVTAPIQYHLAELPPHLLTQCRESYEARPIASQSDTATFRDFMVSGFGQALADLFLIPQNEKTMAISLHRLSNRAVRRFFPPPDENLVRRGMHSGCASASNGTNGYNATFWYPKTGGISRLVDGLRAGLTHCAVNEDVVAIDLRNKTISSRTGNTVPWQVMFSSIPL